MFSPNLRLLTLCKLYNRGFQSGIIVFDGLFLNCKKTLIILFTGLRRMFWELCDFRLYANCMQNCMQLVFKKIRGNNNFLFKRGVLLLDPSPIYQTLYDFYRQLRVRKSIFLQDFCRRLRAML